MLQHLNYLLVHIKNPLREENQRERIVALAHHHGELCLVCREWVSHFTSSAFPWAFPTCEIFKKQPWCTAQLLPKLLWAKTLESVHVLLHSPCLAVSNWFTLMLLRRRRVQSWGGRGCGAQGEQSCPRKAGAQGRTAAVTPSVQFSSAPWKPQAECIGARESHHGKK